MTPQSLLEVLQLAADAMRRTDPTWCAVMDVQQINDLEWDAVLARVEDALDDAREMGAA
jgi:hypothetical protein